MTPTPEELRGAETSVALALGHVVMEAGNLEYEVRLLGMYVAGKETPLHHRLRAGSLQGRNLVDTVRNAAEAALAPELFLPIAAALDEVIEVFNVRSDYVHSAWTSSIFQGSPEPFRLSMRRLQTGGQQPAPAEIHRLQARIAQARRRLTTAFQGAWFAEFSDEPPSAITAGTEGVGPAETAETPEGVDASTRSDPSAPPEQAHS